LAPQNKNKGYSPEQGIGTLVTHAFEGDNPHHAHVAPIFQTSTFTFPDVSTAAAIGRGEREGYLYARYGSPNTDQVARKIALLEGLDLVRSRPDADLDDLVSGRIFSSGMAAISSGVLALVRAGETIVSQRSVYGNTFVLFHETAPRLGIKVLWVRDVSARGWEEALAAHPETRLVYAETPANPTMMVVDLAMVAEIAHRYGCRLMVDNTFATPYCQRPLTLGADIVVHSTTKYISGHGALVGGALVSPHLDYMREDVKGMIRVLGGAPGAFDAWLTNMGLKTFEIRMKRHCENAMAVARYLSGHSKVERVFYPGLEEDPGHELAGRQMLDFGGMLSFELKGGLEAGETLMNHVRVASLAVSLGNVDSLIQHPASMTHRGVPPGDRQEMGISDGLVRLSVGIENLEDIVKDLDQALDAVS
jgi:methionine-gamma-lyase